MALLPVTRTKPYETDIRRLYQVSLGIVNTFLLEDNGLTLIDTGVPGTTDKLFAAIRKGGKNPEDINRVILTHWHPDHAGNAADLKRRLSARVVAHATDAPMVEQGGGAGRPRYLTPGLINLLAFNLFIKNMSPEIPAVPVDEWLNDGDVLPLAGGLRVVHTPGHSAGHMALLLEQEGVLIAGDICANASGLAYSIVYEDNAGPAKHSESRRAALRPSRVWAWQRPEATSQQKAAGKI